MTQTTGPGPISYQACTHAAERLRLLFDGTHDAWEFVGAIRRRQHGHDVEHLVRPRLGEHRAADGGNLVWRRVLELWIDRQVRPCRRAASVVAAADDDDDDGGGGPPPLFWVEPESQVVELLAFGHKHTLYLACHGNWGCRLARTTGDHRFWLMLDRRLQAEGVFKIHRGMVCGYTPQGATQWSPIEVPDEREFFRLARTSYREPQARRGWSPSAWATGMLRPYYPGFFRPIANPLFQPEFFTKDKPAWRPPSKRRAGPGTNGRQH